MVPQFIELLYNIKHNNNIEKQTKTICNLNQKDKSDGDPLVDLEIEGYRCSTSCTRLRLSSKYYESRHLGIIG